MKHKQGSKRTSRKLPNFLPIANLQVVHYYDLTHTFTVSVRNLAQGTQFRVSTGDKLSFLDVTSLRTVTERFLSIDSADDCKRFLEEFGPLAEPSPQRLWEKLKNGGYVNVQLSRVQELQELFRAAWIGKWDEYIANLAGNIDFFVFFDPLHRMYERPVLMTSLDGALEAITLDLIYAGLAGIKSAFCKRPDCGRLFEKTSQHERLYCSLECAHVESVRRHRERIARKKGGR